MNRHDDIGTATEAPSTSGEDAAWSELTGYGSLTPALVSAHRQQDGYTGWLPPAVPAAPPVQQRPDPEVARPGRDTSAGRAVRPRRSWPLVAACAALAGLLAALLVVVVLGSGTQVPVSAPPAASSTTAPPHSSSSAAADWCVSSTSAERVVGDGPGSTGDGPGAILALEHAYYVGRSAAAVRAVLAPDGRFGDDGQIQAGIDSVPAGTTHCVEITGAGVDRWAVTITERRPDGGTVAHRQTIATTVREGRTLVFAVESA